MATVTKPQSVPTTPGARPTPPPSRPQYKPAKEKREYTLLFDKQNYMLMIAGVVLIFIGFMLLSGGKSANPHEFHDEEIYSFRRITLAPIVILLGFITEAYAIMKKPKEVQENTAQ